MIYVNKMGKNYKARLKQSGFADCSVKESLQEADFRKRVMAETYQYQTKKKAREVAEIMYKDGVLPHFRSYLQRGKNVGRR